MAQPGQVRGLGAGDTAGAGAGAQRVPPSYVRGYELRPAAVCPPHPAGCTRGRAPSSAAPQQQARTWRPSMTCTSCTTASAAAGVVKVTKPKPRGRPVCRSRITTCKGISREGQGVGAGPESRAGAGGAGAPGAVALRAPRSPPRRCCHICQSDPAVSLRAGAGGGGLYQRRCACGPSGAPNRDPPGPCRSPPSVVSQDRPPRNSLAEGRCSGAAPSAGALASLSLIVEHECGAKGSLNCCGGRGEGGKWTWSSLEPMQGGGCGALPIQPQGRGPRIAGK